ncbi:MAG TPA: hypothetical protein VKA19_15600 [Alphaproteobacteria bacterium]|nr:hypothetical protein [Alphaproteobacteria bacterium]
MSFAVLFFWKAPGWMTAKLMAMTGVLGGLTHYAIIRALQIALASVIIPFAYTGVLWAIVFGFVVFAEVPSMGILIGAAIIVGSGIYIARVESGRRHVI